MKDRKEMARLIFAHLAKRDALQKEVEEIADRLRFHAELLSRDIALEDVESFSGEEHYINEVRMKDGTVHVLDDPIRRRI
tara:strand:- start:873 stop:1112 length:240 start_codon:yes stop_codon:yes gene_type:complete